MDTVDVHCNALKLWIYLMTSLAFTVHGAVIVKSPSPLAHPAIYIEYEMPSEMMLSRRVTLHANSTVIVEWQAIPASASYVLFQAHSHALPLILSYTMEPTFGNYFNSTNAGLVVLLAPLKIHASVYVHNPHDYDVTTLLVIMTNSWQDPIPGGCNLEFEVEISPILKVSYDRLRTTVEYQKSMEGGGRRDDLSPKSCDHSESTLEYTVYQQFLMERNLDEDEYFAAIERMLTVDSIKRTAIQVGPMSRVEFTNNPGQGVVFNVVVQSVYNTTFLAAYVPAVTYGCDLTSESDDINSCRNSIRPLDWIFRVCCALVGLFICFFGHRFFKTEMFIFGFLAGTLFAYVLIIKYSESDYTVNLLITILIGLIGGTMWTTLWWFAGVPVLSMLLVGLLLGFQLACIIFYTPFGEMEVLKNDFNYGMIFACFVMVPPLFMLCCLEMLSIISSAVIGSYGAIVLVDRYVGTSLSFIVLNVLKRATVPQFHRLNVTTPFQNNDIVLSIAWIILAFSGIIFQTIQGRKRPPFPPPPYSVWRMPPSTFVADYSSSDQDDSDDERRPLLGSRPYFGYEGTSRATNEQGQQTILVHPPSPPLPTATSRRSSRKSLK